MTYTLEFTNSRDENPSTPSTTLSRWDSNEDATQALERFLGEWDEFEVGPVVETAGRYEVRLSDRVLSVSVNRSE